MLKAGGDPGLPCTPDTMLLEYVPYDGEVANDVVEFPHPFEDERDMEKGDKPRTVVELQMCALSATLRSKPEWWRKYTDPEIRARWEKEALAQGLSQKQIDYVLAELAGYAALRDEETGIEVSCADKIWQSDTLIAPELRDALKAAVKVLEDVPEDEKDWHPRSDGLVLDLVHPSLYPLVYGRSMVHWTSTTRGEAIKHVLQNEHTEAYKELQKWWFQSKEPWTTLPSDVRDWCSDHLPHWLCNTREKDVDDIAWSAKAASALSTVEKGCWSDLYAAIRPPFFHRGLQPAAPPKATSVTSDRFAWLPTDFAVGASGAKALGYINNVHPSHTALVAAIERIVGAFVPLFERVLTDLLPENEIPLRVDDFYTRNEDGRPQRREGEDSQQYDERWQHWYDNERAIVMPEPLAYERKIEERARQYSMRGRNIQVIVKLANIVLTPEDPEYRGGSWHVEGMRNERIVASGIFYYDEENIGESRLAFRTAVSGPENYEQCDYSGAREVWGLGHEEALVQDIGSVQTKGGRCIAFPNVFQHCVAPFELVDRTRAGHRKILALFLVDPTVRIPSTSNVAPQQKELLVETLAACGGRLETLPRELLQMIAAADEHTMSRAEAFAYREELMDERTRFVHANNDGYFGALFNMCEH